MTSPPTRRTVRLQSLLDGNRKPRIVHIETPQHESGEEDTMESIEDSSLIDSGACALGESSPPKPDSQSLRKAKSIKDILTGLPISSDTKEQQKLTYTPNEQLRQHLKQDSMVREPKLSLKELLSGKPELNSVKKKEESLLQEDLDLEEIQVIELTNPEKSRRTHERIMKSLLNTKKTSVKSLFSNFSKPTKNDMLINTESLSSSPELPTNRYHSISTLKEISAPYPRCQLHDDNDDRIKYRPLTLKKRVPRIKKDLYFPPHEYSSILDSRHKHKCSEPINIGREESRSSNLTWPREFQPERLSDVLLPDDLKQGVVAWMDNAFLKLRKSTTRHKLLKKKSEDDALDDFIVDDDFDDKPDQIEDFVPLMILHGTQVGKNTILDTVIKSHEGQIFEVNTSSNRGKKEILDSVLDFSTTHFVKNKGSKGIILFDDVDVLFRERDKLFWSAIERILAISRRPVVLTCRDIGYIPLNIIQVAREEESIFHCRGVDDERVVEYLQKCCVFKNIQIPKQLLEQIVQENCGDIRKCSMRLQWICSSGRYGRISMASIPVSPNDLSEHVFTSNMLSSIDVMNKNTKWRSNIKQDIDQTIYCPYSSREFNALSDEQKLTYDYMLDPKIFLPDDLKRPRMPYELNISLYLYSAMYDVHQNLRFDDKSFFFELTGEVIRYLESRVCTNVDRFGRYPNNSDRYTTARMTRNSRRVTEIMDRLSSNEISQNSETLEAFINFITSKSKNTICQEINPIIFEIAKHDKAIKSRNKLIYENSMKGADPSQAKEMIKQLLVDHAFFPIWFKRDPGSCYEYGKIARDINSHSVFSLLHNSRARTQSASFKIC